MQGPCAGEAHLVTASVWLTRNCGPTVGLVVEGTNISAIVPGGPADEAVKGTKLDAHDKILEVDGEKATAKNLPVVRMMHAPQPLRLPTPPPLHTSILPSLSSTIRTPRQPSPPILHPGMAWGVGRMA